jgi:hypothetical protein
VTALLSLAQRWLTEAETLRRYGDERGAHVCELHAAEIEAAVKAANDEQLTLEEAERESGYTRDHLRHLVADGAIPNAGRSGRPRIRRGDLPRKPSAPPPAAGAYNVDADALNIARRLGNA